jgi:hypothetical protein
MTRQASQVKPENQLHSYEQKDFVAAGISRAWGQKRARHANHP